jgi:hypothetical protein
MEQQPRDAIVPSSYPFQGGLDQTSSALAVPAGRVVAGLNYEPVVDGYQRATGYERTDGRLPSTTDYWVLPFIDGSSELHTGDLLVGSTSGAQGRIILVENVTGSWGDETASGRLILVLVSGTFELAEALKVSGSERAVADDLAEIKGAGSVEDEARWVEAAQDWARHLIQKIPGSGPVRGVLVYNGLLYGVRDNEAATKGRMFKATAAGWVEQVLGRLLRFKNGAAGAVPLFPPLAEGDKIVGATSGAKATVKRIVARTGTWGAATSDADKAAGYFIIENQTGTFKKDEVLKVGTTTVAIASTGNSEEITLPPGGRYAFKVKNFYGATNLRRIYGVNGVGPGFEYDGGNVLVPIETGMPEGKDKPDRIFDIANHLGFTFPGGSIQFATPGEPCIFNAILGSAEIGLGDDITDVIDSTDAAVIFFARNKVATLTGRGIDTFVLTEISEEAGAEAWTVQRVGRTMYLDRRGLRDITTTAAYGDFRTGALSELFDTYLQSKRASGARAALSFRVRSRGQYVLLYDDGSGFTVFTGRKALEMLPLELGIVARCVFVGEDDDGTEAIYLGGEDGYVYRYNSGTSFDGVGVAGFCMMPFNHLGNINVSKRGVSVSVELRAAPQTQIGILAQYDYADGEMPHSGSHQFITAGGGGLWGVSNWDEFYWSSPFQGMAEADIAGAGRNISVVFAARSRVTEEAHTLQAYTIRWVPRGRVKRTAR